MPHCPEGVQAWTEDGRHIQEIGKLMERPIVGQHKIILGGATVNPWWCYSLGRSWSREASAMNSAQQYSLNISQGQCYCWDSQGEEDLFLAPSSVP